MNNKKGSRALRDNVGAIATTTRKGALKKHKKGGCVPLVVKAKVV